MLSFIVKGSINMKEQIVKAHITGTIWQIEKGVGDQVEQGEPIVIIESMKMEMELESPVSGVVKQIMVTNEEMVQEGQPIAVIEVNPDETV